MAEKGRQETRCDYYTLCWRQYLVTFMFGFCVWQRGHEVVFPELYPVPGGHTATANNANGIIHKNYERVAELSSILVLTRLYLALIV